MIYAAVKDAVEQVEALADKCFPAGVCIDDVAMPCAVYSFGKRKAIRDLSGQVHHYTDEAIVDVLAEDYDTVHQLAWEVERALSDLAQQPDGAGAYIFGVDCDTPENDGADLSLGLMRRSVQATLQWCPLEDDAGG